MPEYCLHHPVEIKLEEKKSRFIGFGYPCSSLREFDTIAKNLRLRFSDANHMTYAYRIRDNGSLWIKCHDAGEPSGTAGKPILTPMSSKNLVNSVIFVIRYFGGIKLGTGGLVRAYGETAIEVIKAAGVIPFVEWALLNISFSYGMQHQVDYFMSQNKIEVLERIFNEKIVYKIKVPAPEMTGYLKVFSLHDWEVFET